MIDASKPPISRPPCSTDDEEAPHEGKEFSSSSVSTYSSIAQPKLDTTLLIDGRRPMHLLERLQQRLVTYLQWIGGSFRTIISDDSGDTEHILRGIFSIVFLGTLLGLTMPRNPELNGKLYPYMSSILGYTYFVSWSVSYYPQLFQNYHRKDTTGLSIDFCTLQVYGCACYASLNIALYWSNTIQDLYRERHDGQNSLVESNDVAFSLHAFILSIVWISQIWYYNGRSFRNRTPSKGTVWSLVAVSCFFLFYAVAICAYSPTLDDIPQTTNSPHRSLVVATAASWLEDKLDWLSFLYGVTDFKICIIFSSYLPQAVLNYRLRSTKGWNIWGILLDFVGGLFSILQLVLDGWNMKDFSGISGDAAKFGLGFVSIAFDLVFFLQHYVLYRDEHKK